MNIPDIAIINFSGVNDRTVQRAVRAVNRQVVEDFMPIWGSGYISKLHAPTFALDHPDIVSEDPIPAEAVIYLVDNAHLQGALGYHSINSSEVPVGFVFTDLGDWTVTLSHEILELIVDPTVNIFVPGPDPRALDDPSAWLWHSYEVCDAVERTVYEIDEILVSNFITPSYFSAGDSAGTRNDFLGIGVDSFGVLPGCHLGTVDPSTYTWINVLGSEFPSRHQHAQRMKDFGKKGERSRPGRREEDGLYACISQLQEENPTRASVLSKLGSLTRSGRKQAIMTRVQPA